MEAKGKEFRPADLEDSQFLWAIYKTSVPRVLVTSLVGLARYCADQLPKRMTLGYLRILAAILVIVMPRTLTHLLLYPIFRLVFGNLYPAYASYKAVRTKNVKEYVKWMMYWIVFALFTCAETFTDVFFSFWFPFYYEIKTILVVWLLSPATNGSSILYRRFVHPALTRREAEIDEALARATEQGYTAVLHLGSKGVNYATTVLMQTAIKGGGGLVQQLQKSYSLSDLTGAKEDENRNTPHRHDETDMEVKPRRREHAGRRGYSPRRTQSSSTRVDMYFSEVDVDVRQPKSKEPRASLTNIRSSDDISSGYSSGEAVQSTRTSPGDTSLVRTSSVGARTRAKPSTLGYSTQGSREDSDSIDPPFSKNISFPPPLNLVTPEQALEILLLLSQNSNVADYIKLVREPFVTDNDVSRKDTSQSGPQSPELESGGSDADSSDPALTTAQVPIIHTIEMKAVPERPIVSEQANDEPHVKDLDERSKVEKDATTTSDASTSDKDIAKDLTRTVTDQLCQNKFDELKQLLNDARNAVNNIVHTQEKLRHSDSSIAETLSHMDSPRSVGAEETNEKEDAKDSQGDDSAKNALFENESTLYLDARITPTVSRSSSDSLGRAGKYNKKPAPKLPIAKSEEDLSQIDAGNALKATLVIKTGTLKTFSNTGASKDVFIAHAVEGKAKGKKSRKQRTKEGFSKLLTIPKNIFQNAFNREAKGSAKIDDSSPDISSSGSRSNSMEPRETIVELAPKLSDDKSDNDTSNSSGSYTLAADTDNEENAAKLEKAEGKDIQTCGESTELRMREMSQSPKLGKRLESDIF